MPEMNGLEVAASLPTPGPAVVFATAHDAHALRAFELAAVDYLLKPISKERLRHCSLACARGERRRPRTRRLCSPAWSHGPKGWQCARAPSSSSSTRNELPPSSPKITHAAILVDGRELLSEESLDRLMKSPRQQEIPARPSRGDRERRARSGAATRGRSQVLRAARWPSRNANPDQPRQARGLEGTDWGSTDGLPRRHRSRRNAATATVAGATALP